MPAGRRRRSPTSPRFFERVHGRIPIDALKAAGSSTATDSGRAGCARRSSVRSTSSSADHSSRSARCRSCWSPALIIALESGAPIVYRQERVGLRGKTFQVLKFRSMRQDAEKDGKARWAAVDDQRVTKFGRFIRRTRIDELPQLINVLRGEMSFVGPRPERPVFVEMLTEQIPFYAVRHSVKPGITGWAQVRYSYGANVEQSMKKLEYDLYYVKNHSLFLDLLILLETVRVVLARRRGAIAGTSVDAPPPRVRPVAGPALYARPPVSRRRRALRADRAFSPMPGRNTIPDCFLARA